MSLEVQAHPGLEPDQIHGTAPTVTPSHLDLSLLMLRMTALALKTLIPKYLEACVDTGELRQSLREIDVTHSSGDVELFRWIRKSYSEMRGGRMYRTVASVWLRSPCASSTFGVEQRDKVHILCRDESYPPRVEVKEGRYHYTPCPMRPEGSMPMPSDTFVHYLHHCNLNVEVLPPHRGSGSTGI